MAQYVEVNGQTIEFPDGMAAPAIEAAIKKNYLSIAPAAVTAPKPSLKDEGYDKVMNYSGKDAIGGQLRGAGSIGSTLLAPIDAAARFFNGGKPINIGGYDIVGQDRRQGMDAGLDSLGVNRESMAFGANKLGAEIMGTAGTGGLLGNAVARIPGAAAALPSLLPAIKSAGMTANGVSGVRGLGLRATGGAATGGASAGLLNPDDVGLGALIGGGFPVAAKAVGLGGQAIGSAYRSMTTPAETKIARQLAGLSGRRMEDLLPLLRQEGPQMMPGYRATVPQLLQTPELSQLQRTLKTAGSNALGDAERAQQAQMMQALNRVAPVDISVNDAAARAGDALQNFARPARAEASKAVKGLFDSVDPFNESQIFLPLNQMKAAQSEFLGRGTFGTGSKAQQAIATASDIGTEQLAALKAIKAPAPQTLQQAVRARGGVKTGSGGALEGEVNTIRQRESGSSGLRTQYGQDLDTLAQDMRERGFTKTDDPTELLDALRGSIGGKQQYANDYMEEGFQSMAERAMGDAPQAQSIAKAVPWRELQNLRSSIGEAAESSSAKGANKEAAALRGMVSALDDKAQSLAGGSGQLGEFFDQDMAKTYREALAAHQAKMQRFETGPQAGLFRKAGDGQMQIQGAEIAPKFYSGRGSQVDDVKSLKRLVGDRQDLMGDMKRFAVTQAADTADQMGNLTTKYTDFLLSRAGANRELFNKTELSTLQQVGSAVERQFKAEGLGRVTGSDTAQKLQSLAGLGLLDSRAVSVLANRIPVLGQFTGPMIEGLRNTAKAKQNQVMGGLLADPDALLRALKYSQTPSRLGQGLLSAQPLLYKTLPVLSAQ